MKKSFLAILVSGMVMTASKAQTIQEGVGHLYADRMQSAVGVFQKLIAQNPNNIDAIYWLGQTYFDMDENQMAKEVYEKALAANGNAPLLLAGMGHFQLLDKKTNEARQSFETAITMSKDKKGKDNPDILNAIGRAHVDAKSGDHKYAEQILQSASTLNPKNPDIFLNLGNAIRKARPGEAGRDAYSAFTSAISLNPNFAYAYVRIASLFESQRNYELVLENLNKAASVDPNFSKAYYELFYYYFPRKDFENAEINFNKYVNTRPNEDQTEHEYLNSQLCWAKKDYDCAITKAENVKAVKQKPRVFKQLAYSYLGKGDFASAKKNVDEFFAREKDGFLPSDYTLKAQIYSGAGAPCEDLYNVYMAGAASDTILQSRIDYMIDAAEDFKKRNCKKQEADMRLAIFNTRTRPNANTLVNIGTLYNQAGDFVKADSIFSAYTTLMPDSIYGHYWRGKVNGTIDTSYKLEPYVSNMINGYTKALDIAQLDKVRYKSLGITSSLALIGYYNNIKADKEAALVPALKGLELDTSNAQLKGIVEYLKRPTPARPGGGQRPNNAPSKPTGSKPVASVSKTKTAGIKPDTK